MNKLRTEQLTRYILSLNIDTQGIKRIDKTYHMVKYFMHKTCEFVFYGTKLNITLNINNTKPKAVQNRVRKPRTEKVVVKWFSSIYTDLLKTVKKKVDLRQHPTN